MNHKHKT